MSNTLKIGLLLIGLVLLFTSLFIVGIAIIAGVVIIDNKQSKGTSLTGIHKGLSVPVANTFVIVFGFLSFALIAAIPNINDVEASSADTIKATIIGLIVGISVSAVGLVLINRSKK